MTQRAGVEYVRYYTSGSAALKLEPVQDPRFVPTETPAASPYKLKRKKIFVDPVAVASILLAVCMLVAVFAGFARLKQARGEVEAMEAYVHTLQAEHAVLNRRYKSGYDLEVIRETALALDMIPAEQAACVKIPIPQEQENPAQMSFWERLDTFFAGLLA